MHLLFTAFALNREKVIREGINIKQARKLLKEDDEHNRSKNRISLKFPVHQKKAYRMHL